MNKNPELHINMKWAGKNRLIITAESEDTKFIKNFWNFFKTTMEEFKKYEVKRLSPYHFGGELYK